jgi:hypothetical protein
MEKAIVSLCIYCMCNTAGLRHVEDRFDCLFSPTDPLFEV